MPSFESSYALVGQVQAWGTAGKREPCLERPGQKVFESWPLWEHARRFDLGHVINCAVIDLIQPSELGALGVHHAGLWQCDLVDDSLTWSGGVYDIFGLPRASPVSREKAMSHFSTESRARLERLSSYAIHNRRGFTIDVEIRAAAVGQSRSVRIIGAPVCEGAEVVRLLGLTLII